MESEVIITKEIEDPSVESSCVTSIVQAAASKKSKTNGTEPYTFPSAVTVAVVSETPVEDSAEEALAVKREASTSDVFVLTPAGTGKTKCSLDLGNAVLPASFTTDADASGDERTSPDADSMVDKKDASEMGTPIDVTDPLGASPWVTIMSDAVSIENIALEAEEKPLSTVNGVAGQQTVVSDSPASTTEVSAAMGLSSKDISSKANSESLTDRVIYEDPGAPGECPVVNYAPVWTGCVIFYSF